MTTANIKPRHVLERALTVLQNFTFSLLEKNERFYGNGIGTRDACTCTIYSLLSKKFPEIPEKIGNISRIYGNCSVIRQ